MQIESSEIENKIITKRLVIIELKLLNQFEIHSILLFWLSQKLESKQINSTNLKLDVFLRIEIDNLVNEWILKSFACQELFSIIRSNEGGEEKQWKAKNHIDAPSCNIRSN